MAEAAQRLDKAGVSEPRMEAGLLLADAIDSNRAFILAHPEHALTANQLDVFWSSVSRRAGGEPLQYITGHQEFFKLDFEVTPAVLIPRPETELIVEAALEISRADPEHLILDIGTGSGCIVVSLLHELPAARATATDVSVETLSIARRNAERHGVIERLALIQSDVFSAFQTRPRFSLIVSNPPYIAETEIESLQREVRDHEPLAALVSGADGLSHVRVLLRDVPEYLSSGGYFIFEIGFGQRDAVEQLIDAQVWNLIKIRTDLQDIARTFVLQKR